MRLSLTPAAASTLSHASVGIVEGVVSWFTNHSRSEFAKHPTDILIQKVWSSPEDAMEIAVTATKKRADDFILIAAGLHLAAEEMRRAATLLRRTNMMSQVLALDLDGISVVDFQCLLRLWDAPSNTKMDPPSEKGALDAFWMELESAQRWRPTLARQNFRNLLAQAQQRPQVLERNGGMELVVMPRWLLDQLRPTRTPSEISAALSKSGPLQPLEIPRRTAARPAFELPVLENEQAAGSSVGVVNIIEKPIVVSAVEVEAETAFEEVQVAVPHKWAES